MTSHANSIASAQLDDTNLDAAGFTRALAAVRLLQCCKVVRQDLDVRIRQRLRRRGHLAVQVEPRGRLEAASFLVPGTVAAPVVILEGSLARESRLGKTLEPGTWCERHPAGRAAAADVRSRLRRPVLSP